eukprot:gene29926-57516_t
MVTVVLSGEGISGEVVLFGETGFGEVHGACYEHEGGAWECDCVSGFACVPSCAESPHVCAAVTSVITDEAVKVLFLEECSASLSPVMCVG